MTREDLNERIQKINAKIEKIEKRIQKWLTGMNDEAKAVVAACELLYDDPKYKDAYAAYKAYSDEHSNDPSVFNQEDWNKGPQFGEAYRAYRDLAEAKNTLHKYEVSLDKLTNFDNAEKIEVIWSFLQEWKAEFREYIINGCELYGRLKDNFSQAWNKYKLSQEYKDDIDLYLNRGWQKWNAEYQLEKAFRERYYSEVPSLSKKFHTRHGACDEAALDKFLDAEVRAKYNDLVRRITEKAGEIVDASNLYIAADGQINGIVNGTKHNVKVETIPAGGYNIQQFHYRVLVHVI